MDPLGLKEQVMALFDEWARAIEENPTDKVQAQFVVQLQAAGFLKVSGKASFRCSSSPRTLR